MTQQVETISTYLGKTKARVLGVVLLVWLVLFSIGFGTNGCTDFSVDPAARLGVCNRSLTLNSIIPGYSQHAARLYVFRGIAYVDLGETESAYADFLTAISSKSRGRMPYDGTGEDAPRWYRELSRPIEEIRETNAPAVEAWDRVRHAMKCRRLGARPPECRASGGNSPAAEKVAGDRETEGAE